MTGNQKYLKSYGKYSEDVEPGLEGVFSRHTRGLIQLLPSVRLPLHVLIGKRLADQLSMVLAIQKSQGTSAAISLDRKPASARRPARPSPVFLEQVRDRRIAGE